MTPPMQVDPVTASFPAGARPDTDTVLGPAGSSLVTVMIPDFDPKLVGANRIGTSTAVPGAIAIGKDCTSATVNSTEDEVMLLTAIGHGELLSKVRGMSKWLPTQTSPNSPSVGKIRSSLGARETPDTSMVLDWNNPVSTVIVALLGPNEVGRNRIGT